MTSTVKIKNPNRAINLIRLAFIDGIRNTNRINVVDAVSAGSDLSLSPLEMHAASEQSTC